MPVYRLTAGLTAVRLRSAIREALDQAGYAYPEYLPADDHAPTKGSCRSPGRSRRPTTRTSFEARDAALRRLAFDELLALQLGMVARRRQRVRDAAPEVAVDDGRRRRRSGRRSSARSARRVGRPVELTADQVAAIDADP